MLKCPKCGETISLLAHDISVYGFNKTLKALSCSKCHTIITVIPAKETKKMNIKEKEQQPNIYHI